MRSILLVVGLVGATSPIQAQSPIPQFDDAVVVTATQAAEERDSLPVSVTVVDEQAIQDRQATSVTELLATVAGTHVVSSGVPGQQTSVFTRGTESDQTLILWNGVELNNPFFGGANWQFLPTDGVERVEVARGPLSSVWGGNALGGVVQVLTGRRDGGSLTLEGGEDSYLRGGLSYGRALGEDVRLDLLGHLRRGDSEFDNGYFDSEELSARLDWSVTPSATLGILARANDSDTGIPFAGGQPSPGRNIRWSERQYVVPGSWESGSFSVVGQLSKVEFDNSFRDPMSAFGFTENDTESSAERLRAAATYHGGESWRFSFGGESEQVEVDDISSFGTNLEGDEQSTWAAFAEGSLDLGRATVNLGVRQDDSDEFGAETSSRAGLSVDLGGGTRLTASYGEAFRPPTVGEQFFPFTGNPDLSPERSESYEVSLSNRRGAFELGVTGFSIDLEDLIDFDFVTFRNVNVGSARSQGFEAMVRYRGDRVRVDFSATLLDAEDLDADLPLLRRPDESASLVVTGTPGRWTLTAVGQYVGDRPDIDPVTFARADNESYTRIDLVARWAVSDRFTPFVRVLNAGDEEYFEALGFPAAGRTLSGGLSLSFR